jgi:D-alanine-D-alanine ligase
MLEDERPSLVFNLTEHVYGDRRMDSHICALMELERIAYTGTGPTGLALCRDKALSKVMAERAGFRVPAWFATQTWQPRVPPGVRFPLVVKPRFGDGSEGIGQNSLVASHADLMARIRALGSGGVKDAICEEYIAGREMVIAIAGLRTMPVREFVVGRKGDGAPVLACQRFKHDAAYRRRWRVRMVFAELTRGEQRTLNELALRTFDALDMRDYGRLDVKLAPSGDWVFLEANPNPALAPFQRSFSGSWAGVDFDRLVKEIATRAMRRGRVIGA